MHRDAGYVLFFTFAEPDLATLGIHPAGSVRRAGAKFPAGVARESCFPTNRFRFLVTSEITDPLQQNGALKRHSPERMLHHTPSEPSGGRNAEASIPIQVPTRKFEQTTTDEHTMTQ